MSQSPAKDYLNREFPMSSGNFETIKQVAYEFTGINLTEHKRDMIYSRLARRLRSLSLVNFDQYCELLTVSEHPEHNEFINAITTNLTSFFRESHHFEYLKKTVIPELLSKHRVDKRIRFWSAGSSTGEEPYSLAITLRESIPAAYDAKLLATDLDSNVLNHGRQGVYEINRIDTVSEERRKKWFYASRDGDTVKVKKTLEDLVSFKRLNLLENWPMKGPFDVIFCRNVVIYFDKETQRKLFNRYADILAPGGYLFIGHSENLHKVSDRFKSLGQTVYQRIK